MAAGRREELLAAWNRDVIDLIDASDGAATLDRVLNLPVIDAAVRDRKLSPTLQELQRGGGAIASAIKFRWDERAGVFVRRGAIGDHALAGVHLRRTVEERTRRLDAFPRCLMNANRGDLHTEKDAPGKPAHLGDVKAKTGVTIVTLSQVAAVAAAVEAVRAVVGHDNATVLKKGVPCRIRIEAPWELRERALRNLEMMTDKEGGDLDATLTVTGAAATIVDVFDSELSTIVTEQLEALGKAWELLGKHMETRPPQGTDEPTAAAAVVKDGEHGHHDKLLKAMARSVRDTSLDETLQTDNSSAVRRQRLLLGEFTIIPEAGRLQPNNSDEPDAQVAEWVGTVGIAPLTGWVCGRNMANLERIKKLSDCTRLAVVKRPHIGDDIVTARGPKAVVLQALRFARTFVLRRFAYNPEHPSHQFPHRSILHIRPANVAHLVGAGGRNLMTVMLDLGVGLACIDEILHVGAHTEAGIAAALAHPGISPFLA